MIVIISSILMLMAMMSKLCLAEVQQKKKHQLTHKSSLSPSICLYDLELINSFDLF